MLPVGPFTSPWNDLGQFIIKDAQGQIRVVTNGMQPMDGMPFFTLADARWHLKRNGLELVKDARPLLALALLTFEPFAPPD